MWIYLFVKLHFALFSLFTLGFYLRERQTDSIYREPVGCFVSPHLQGSYTGALQLSAERQSQEVWSLSTI